MKRAPLILLWFLACAATAWAQVQVRKPPERARVAVAPQITVRDASFRSAALGREMKYRILLPAGYDRGMRRYPVLYLLHGLGGSYDNWDTRTHLREYVAPLPLIVVMPDADNSWYTNSAANPQDRFEDYIAKDLVEEIDKRYRTIATRHGRAIAGLSMGGYGTTKFGLKYSNLFVFAASFSGALAGARDADFKPRLGETYARQMAEIFGPAGGAVRAANDVYALAEPSDPASLPYLWLVCGSSDRLLESNREFVALLQRRHIAYTYKEAPGGHEWRFWDEQFPAMLRELARHMNLSSARH